MADVKISELNNATSITPDDLFVIVDDPSGSPVTKNVSLSQLSSVLGSGLSDSDRYILCKAGDDIAAKYAAAKLLTPGSAALSATNRAYLVVMPGVYPLTAQWEIDAEFVDIIGLGSTPLDRGCNVSVTVTDFDINVSANDVRIKGIGTPSDRVIKTVADKPLQVFEECVGGSVSDGIFGIPSFGIYGGTGESVTGTFINCSGGDYSFGGVGSTASGTFINCSGGNYSFGGGYGGVGTAPGTFTNCVGGEYSFGADTASGTFKDCSGGYGSFGGSIGTASGTFTNCSGGDSSFGGHTASGTFTNCSGGDFSFGLLLPLGGGTASGTFKDCSGGAYSFGGGGTASGTFINCSGGDGSFGGVGIASGTFLRCTLTSGTFQTLSETGKYRLCIDGNYDVINADAPTTP